MNLQARKPIRYADNHLKFSLSPFNGLAPRNCQTWASLTLPLRFESDRIAALPQNVAMCGLWNAAKLFARDHLRKNRCTTPKAGLESVAEVVDIYRQATRRQR